MNNSLVGPYLITNPYSDLYMDDKSFIEHNSPIFFPKQTKFKGWMREKRRCTFNKNK